MATIGELIVDFEVETKAVREAARRVSRFARDTNAGFKSASDSVDRFGARANAVLTRVNRNLTSLGTSFSFRGTLPIVGAFALLGKTAGDQEQAITGVRKVVNATDAEFNTFVQTIKSLSSVTPTATNELFGIAETAGILGLSINELAPFSEVIAKIGAATSLTVDTAAESLAKFGNITEGGVQNIDRIGSALVELGNNMAANESQILAVSSRLQGLAIQAGLSSTEVLGLSAAAAALDLRPEQVEGTLTKTFVQLQKIVRESGIELQTLADVSGVTAERFTDIFRESNFAGFQLFLQGLQRARASGQELDAIYEQLGFSGSRLSVVLSRLGGNYDFVQRAIELSNKGYRENIALNEEAGLFYSTFNNILITLKNDIVELAASLGSGFLPIFKDWVDTFKSGVVPVLQDAVRWFNSLDESTRSSVAIFAGLVAAIGPLLIGIGVIAGLLAPIATGFGLVAVAVAGVIAVTATLIGYWDEIRTIAGNLGDFFAQTWENIRRDVGRLVDFIRDAFNRLFGDVLDRFVNFVKRIGDSIASVIERIGGGTVNLPGLGIDPEEQRRINEQTEAYTELNTAITQLNQTRREAVGAPSVVSENRIQEEVANGMQKGITDGTKELGTQLRDTVSPIFAEAVGGFEDGMDDAIRDVFQNNESILGVFRRASLEFVEGLQGGISSSLSSEAGNLFSKGFTDSVNTLQKTFKPTLDSLGNSLSELKDIIPQSISSRAGTLAAGGAAVIGGAQQGGFGGAISGIAGGAAIGASFGGPVGAIIGGIIGGVTSLFGGGKSERIKVEAEAFTVAQGLTADLTAGVGQGFIRASERKIQDFNSNDAARLTQFAIDDFLTGIQNTLQTLPGQIRERALETFKAFEFQAQKLFSESGDPTLQSFRSFLEGGLSGRLTQQLEPVFVEIFQGLGASAERSSEFFQDRFAAIAGSHSQEVAKQLELRFRQDFAALVEVANITSGNTGIVGAIDRVSSLLSELGVSLSGALNFDAVIARAKELVAALEIDPTSSAQIKEVLDLLVAIPAQLGSAINRIASRISSFGDLSSRAGDVTGALRGSVNALEELLQNEELSLEQRNSLLNTQAGSIQQLIALERQAFDAQQASTQSTLDSIRAKEEAEKRAIEETTRQLVTQLVRIPAQLGNAIGSLASRIASFSGLSTQVADIPATLRASLRALDQLADNEKLSIEDRGTLINVQAGHIQQLIALEREQFDAQQQAIRERTQEQIRLAQDRFRAEREGIEERFRSQEAAAESFLESIATQIDSARQLQSIYEATQRLGDSIEDTITRLNLSSDSPLSSSQQADFLLQRQRQLESSLQGAEGEERVSILNELRNVFSQIADVGSSFGEGSPQQRALFNFAQEGLRGLQQDTAFAAQSQEDKLTMLAQLQESTRDSIQELNNDRLAAIEALEQRHEERLQALQEVEERQFQLSGATQALLDKFQADQIALMNQNVGLLQNQSDGFLQNLQTMQSIQEKQVEEFALSMETQALLDRHLTHQVDLLNEHSNLLNTQTSAIQDDIGDRLKDIADQALDKAANDGEAQEEMIGQLDQQTGIMGAQTDELRGIRGAIGSLRTSIQRPSITYVTNNPTQIRLIRAR